MRDQTNGQAQSDEPTNCISDFLNYRQLGGLSLRIARFAQTGFVWRVVSAWITQRGILYFTWYVEKPLVFLSVNSEWVFVKLRWVLSNYRILCLQRRKLVFRKFSDFVGVAFSLLTGYRRDWLHSGEAIVKRAASSLLKTKIILLNFFTE